MKRLASRIISLLLVTILLLPLIPSSVFAANSTPIKTKAQAISWIVAAEGQYIDFDGAYGAQCVDLVKAYYDFLGVSVKKGNACDYITDDSLVPTGWSRIKYYDGFVAEPGDIVLFDKNKYSPTYGHIGLVQFATSTVITTLENNLDGTGTQPAKKCSRTYTGSMNFWGVIRPEYADVPQNPVDSNGFVYEMNEDRKSYSVVGYEGSSKTLEIPDMFKGLPVTKIGKAAFHSLNITSIYIPASITHIGYRALVNDTLTTYVVDKNNPVYRSVDKKYIIEPETKTFVYGSNPAHIPKDGSVTKIGDYAFATRTNITDVTIPSTILSIGVSAFEDCINLKSIQIPDSVQEICAQVFWECISLSDIVIPDSVKSIGDNAFLMCNSLESVYISKSVKTMGYNIFENCSSLSTIFCESYPKPEGWSENWLGSCSGKIFWGTADDAIEFVDATSDDTYFYVTLAYSLLSQESAWMSFSHHPANSSNYVTISDLSIIVPRGVGQHTFKIPKKVVSDDDILFCLQRSLVDSSTILKKLFYNLGSIRSSQIVACFGDYYDKLDVMSFSLVGNLMPARSFTVNVDGKSYTSQSGYKATIPEPNKLISTVKISKIQHYDLSIPGEVLGSSNNVYLTPTSVTKPFIDNFYIRCSDSTSSYVNALVDSITITEESAQEFDIYVSANCLGATPLKFYILQGASKIYLRQGYNQNVRIGEQLTKNGEKIQICVETAGGVYKSPTKITVNNLSLSIRLDPGCEATASSENIDALKGQAFKLSTCFLDSIPVSITPSNDGRTLTGVIGVKLVEESDKRTWSEKTKKAIYSKDSKDIIQTIKELKKKKKTDFWEGKTTIGITGTVNILGCFEGHFLSEEEDPTRSGSFVFDKFFYVVSFEEKLSTSVQTVIVTPVMAVPVYWETALAAKFSFSQALEHQVIDDTWNITMPSIDIVIEMSITGAIGIKKIASAGLKGTGSVNIKIDGPQSYAFMQANAKLVLEAWCFRSWTYEKELWKGEPEYLWGAEYAETQKLSSPYTDANNYSVMKAIPNRVLNSSTENRHTEDGLNYSVKEIDALSYSSSGVQFAILPNGNILIVWTDSVESRSDINKIALYYSIYDVTADVYSDPVLVWDDATGDYLPKLNTCGENIYLTWNNANQVMPDDTDLSTYVTTLDIAFAEFDCNTNEFVNCVNITNNDIFDYSPAVAECNGEPYVVWLSDESGECFNATTSVKLNASYYSDAAWSEPSVLSEEGCIVSMTALNNDYGAHVYYCVDSDIDLTTEEDQEIYEYLNGGVTCLTDNSTPDLDIRSLNNQPIWLSNGSLTDGESILANNINNNVYGVAKKDDVSVVVYSQTIGSDSDKDAIYAVFSTKDSVGSPIKIAEGDFVRTIDVFYENDRLVVYTTENVFDDNNIVDSKIKRYTVTIPSSISIENATYNEYSMISGGSLAAEVEVKNLSEYKIDKYIVSYTDPATDETVEKTYTMSTDAGTTATLEIELPVPVSAEANVVNYTICPVFSNGLYGEATNASLTVRPYDVTLDSLSAVKDDEGTTRVSFIVGNRGLAEMSNVVATIYDKNDEVLYTATLDTIGSCGSIIHEVEFDSLELDQYIRVSLTSPYEENLTVNNESFTMVVAPQVFSYEEEEADNLLYDGASILIENPDEIFAFIPEEDGYYAFFSSGDADTIGYLYDSNMELIATDDNGEDHVNFRIEYEFKAGETYIFKFESVLEGKSYYINLVKFTPATSISIDQDDKIEAYRFDSIEMSASFGSKNVFKESYTWSSDNEEVVTIDESGIVSCISCGVATITVVSENGLTDSVEITVNDFETLQIGETINISLSTIGQKAYYNITPEKDGVYAFCSESNLDTFACLLDSDGNELYVDDDSYTDKNFKLECFMQANENYILCISNYSAYDVGILVLTSVELDFAENINILNGDQIVGHAGETHILDIEFSPQLCISENLTWSSSNSDVVSVSFDGTISMIKKGKATIQVTSDSGLVDTIEIIVVDYPFVYTEGDSVYTNLAKNKKYSVIGDPYTNSSWTDTDSNGNPLGKLTDGVVASIGDEKTIGAYCGSVVSVIIDLDHICDVQSIRTDLYGNDTWGIQNPANYQIDVEISENGSLFRSLGKASMNYETITENWVLCEFELAAEQEKATGRYVKLTYTNPSGNSNYVWGSEIRVFGTPNNLILNNSYQTNIPPLAEYPDTSGRELTDGTCVGNNDISNPPYTDARWVGYAVSSSVPHLDIIIPLGDGNSLYELYSLDLAIGTDKMGAGIYEPSFTVYYTVDGYFYREFSSYTREATTDGYVLNISLKRDEPVYASGVKIVFKHDSQKANLVWISEIAAYGVKSEKEKPTYILGDINNDIAVDSADCLLLKRMYFGLYVFSDVEKLRADIDRNKQIALADYLMIKRMVLNTYVPEYILL